MDSTKGRRGHRLPNSDSIFFSPSCSLVMSWLSIQCANISVINKRKQEGKAASSISRQKVWLQYFQQEKVKFNFMTFFVKCLLSRETVGLETLRISCHIDITSVCPRRQDFFFSAFLSFSMDRPSQPQKVFCAAPASMTLITYHFPSPGGQTSELPGGFGLYQWNGPYGWQHKVH